MEADKGSFPGAQDLNTLQPGAGRPGPGSARLIKQADAPEVMPLAHPLASPRWRVGGVS